MARILLPTDFSDASLNACLYALDLFGTKGNTYVLLHGYLDPLPDDVYWGGMNKALYDASAEGMAAFQQRLERARDLGPAEVRTRVRYGPLVTVVAEVMEEESLEVVVMGTAGDTENILLGSHASTLAKQSRWPVLIVPDKARFTGLHKILLADDHKGVHTKALRWLLRTVHHHAAHVYVGHVLKNEDERPDPRIVEAYEKALGQVKHGYLGVPGDDPVLALDQVALRDGMDLLVVVHRHLGPLESLFHRSTAKRLALHATLPLLVLEEQPVPVGH